MRFRRRCFLIRYPFGDDRWQGDAALNETEAMSQTPSLAQLQPADAFLRRHLGADPAEQQAMLDFLGVSTRAELIVQTVPPAIRLNRPLELPAALDEQAALARLRGYAGLNQRWTSLIGMGYYGTVTPPVILRNVLENPGWYTAYTPYQPEIAQGRLEALLNFQQLTIDLTGLDLASASLLDEATASAEAMALARRVAKARSNRFFVDAHCHPQTVSVLRTRAEAFGFELVVDEPDNLAAHAVFGALLQYPDSRGEIRDLRPLIEALHGQQALACVASDLLALLVLTPPGELGADVVLGSAQRFGVPMGYGGPHAAFFATREGYKRAMPGRIIGVSRDARGNPALRMALQTREQHIRREKANSNICTAQVLLANIASLYAVYHGPQELKRIAQRVQRLTALLAAGLESKGLRRLNRHFFDTLTYEVGERQAAILERARAARVNLRVVDDRRLALSLDETCDAATLATLFEIFLGAGHGLDVAHLDGGAVADGIPAVLQRTSAYLQHPVFNAHHSETEMLRYLRQLEGKDLALNQAMIPLGSCTMKLNASSEMIPITWPEFAELHPFVPREQAEGYRRMIDELEAWLRAITGFDAICMQPNSGAQGEYAGLLAIRRYHQSRGDSQRDICLIPASAHGTNPASAIMASMRVVIVECDPRGNVDLDDLRLKAAEAGDRLSCLMITYPSTHGVYEEGIGEICEVVHRHGGQVYMDGANLNAQVGLARPADIGADVSHMNLHKTFCIPPWWWRTGHGADRGQAAPGAVRRQPPGDPRRRAEPAERRGQRGALGQRQHPADQLDVHRHDGPAVGRRQRGGDPLRQLPGEPPGRGVPGALPRAQRARRPRMHPRPATAQGADRDHRGRRGQAPDGLRLPRPDHVLPGTGHADGGADRERVEGGAGSLRRGDAEHQGRDRQGGKRRLAGGGQPAETGAAYPGRRYRDLAETLRDRRGSDPERTCAGVQVLAGG